MVVPRVPTPAQLASAQSIPVPVLPPASQSLSKLSLQNATVVSGVPAVTPPPVAELQSQYGLAIPGLILGLESSQSALPALGAVLLDPAGGQPGPELQVALVAL